MHISRFYRSSGQLFLQRDSNPGTSDNETDIATNWATFAYGDLRTNFKCFKQTYESALGLYYQYLLNVDFPNISDVIKLLHLIGLRQLISKHWFIHANRKLGYLSICPFHGLTDHQYSSSYNVTRTQVLATTRPTSLPTSYGNLRTKLNALNRRMRVH